MIIVGLTGGIGSGKSTLANYFKEHLGVPVYIADDEAKKIMHTTPLQKAIVNLLGKDAYQDGVLNRKYIAQLVFKDEKLLAQLNAIVHPAVGAHFKEWVKNQTSHYVIKEAAILFESGAHKDCDYTIMITAPKEERIKRVLKRDSTTREDIENRISKQWEDKKKIKLSDFVIENLNLSEAKKQAKQIHVKILQTRINS